MDNFVRELTKVKVKKSDDKGLIYVGDFVIVEKRPSTRWCLNNNVLSSNGTKLCVFMLYIL